MASANLISKIAYNIVRNQPKPIPINEQEAVQMAMSLLEEFDIKEKDHA